MNVTNFIIKKIFFVLITLLVMPSCSPQLIFKLDFDNDLDELNTKQLLSNKFIELSKDNGINGTNAVKVSYVGYNKGSKLVKKVFKLPTNVDEATLNYSVKFDKDFKFVKGGKLHGLMPENRITGGNDVMPDGWSARATFKPEGKIASYIYHQNKPKKWGDGYSSSEVVFTPGKYNEVAIYVKLNHPPSSKNGVFEVWVDGSLIISHYSLQYRKEGGDNSLIKYFYFTTFHGGHTNQYAPKDSLGNYTTESAWFDNFEIYKGKHVISLN